MKENIFFHENNLALRNINYCLILTFQYDLFAIQILLSIFALRLLYYLNTVY